jgi:hypothetical protein
VTANDLDRTETPAAPMQPLAAAGS